MYPHRRANAVILAASAVVFLFSWFFIREQVGIQDRQFLRSMIPHHAGAILMREGAALRDPDIQELCRSTIAGQQAEIDQMRAKLEALSR